MSISDTTPTVITRDTSLDGASSGPLTVAADATLTLGGEHDGPVLVEGGGTLVVQGTVRGAVTIESLGTAFVSGDVVGSVDIRVAATLVVEASGRVGGPVSNFGSFTNHGMRAGRVEGRTPDDQPESVEVEPTHSGGAETYRLPDRD